MKKPCQACIENHQLLVMLIAELRQRIDVLEKSIACTGIDIELLAEHTGCDLEYNDADENISHGRLQ